MAICLPYKLFGSGRTSSVELAVHFLWQTEEIKEFCKGQAIPKIHRIHQHFHKRGENASGTRLTFTLTNSYALASKSPNLGAYLLSRLTFTQHVGFEWEAQATERGGMDTPQPTRHQLPSKSIDLFSLYVLFSNFKPRDVTRGNSFFQMSSYARANVRITNDKNKKKIPMRALRGPKRENKMYKLKRSIGEEFHLTLFTWIPSCRTSPVSQPIRSTVIQCQWTLLSTRSCKILPFLL